MANVNKAEAKSSHLESRIKTSPPRISTIEKTQKARPPAAASFVTFTGSETGPVTRNTVVNAVPNARYLESVFSAALLNIPES
jgi:hypothetical protein